MIYLPIIYLFSLFTLSLGLSDFNDDSDFLFNESSSFSSFIFIPNNNNDYETVKIILICLCCLLFITIVALSIYLFYLMKYRNQKKQEIIQKDEELWGLGKSSDTTISISLIDRDSKSDYSSSEAMESETNSETEEESETESETSETESETETTESKIYYSNNSSILSD